MTVALLERPGKIKLSVDQFDLLTESGGLRGLERSELIDGDIYLMSPQYTRHARAKAVIYEALLDWKRVHRPELWVLSEVSVAMPPHDEPMPDIVLCDASSGDRGITVSTVHLLVEIAGGDAAHDLGDKADLYARQGVPEYWIVDLPNRRVVSHSGPTADGYSGRDKLAFGEHLASQTLERLVVDTTDLAD